MELFAVRLVATLVLAIDANGFGMVGLPLVGKKFGLTRLASEELIQEVWKVHFQIQFVSASTTD